MFRSVERVVENMKKFIHSEEDIQSIKTQSFGDTPQRPNASAQEVLFCEFDEQAMHDQYEIHEKIGEGSEGWVFSATQYSTNKKVIIKSINNFLSASYSAK